MTQETSDVTTKQGNLWGYIYRWHFRPTGIPNSTHRFQLEFLKVKIHDPTGLSPPSGDGAAGTGFHH